MSTKKAMESLLTEYEGTKFLVARDLSGWDIKTLNSATMAKNQATARLPQLITKYHSLLLQSTTCFLVYGNNDEYGAFEDQLSTVLKDGVYFTDSTLSLYEFLSPRVEQNMTADRSFDVHSLMILVSEMATLGKELGKISILEPKLATVKTARTHEEVVLTIRDTIMVNSKYEFMLDYVGHNLTQSALSISHAANSTVFVLRCLNAQEAQDLSNSKSFTLDLSITQDYTKLIRDTLKTHKGA